MMQAVAVAVHTRIGLLVAVAATFSACILPRGGEALFDGAGGLGGEGGTSSLSFSASDSSSSSDSSSAANSGGAGGTAGSGGFGGSGVGGDGAVVWHSWDTVIKANGTAEVTGTGSTAVLELYLSVSNTDLTLQTALTKFQSGAHPHGFNLIENFVTNQASNLYPHAGKSTQNRGDGAGEMMNVPLPTGVRDLQVHPSNDDRLLVAAFVADRKSVV
jgi:hypothetical protein